MIEPLLDKIRDLEKANRRWKAACTILATALIAIAVSGSVFFGWHGIRGLSAQRRAMEEADRARMMEMVAREQAQRAEQAARQALEQVEKAQHQQKKE